MGVGGLKALGVKDLTYKTAFLACMAQSAEARVSLHSDLFTIERAADDTSTTSRMPPTSAQTAKAALQKTRAKNSCNRSPLRRLTSSS